MKSQRFSFSRVLMMFMFAILTSLVLVACGDSDQDLVDAAIDTVGITYASGDSQNSVTENLILPDLSTPNGTVKTTWSAENSSESVLIITPFSFWMSCLTVWFMLIFRF